ncbi:MAG: PA0069 family radical SAM protein, partial [Alphaproteobacteria bacterium]
HGCVYCFARPTHAWLGLSPGLDFETMLFAKHDAATLLERELRAPSYRCKVIALGVNTDAYQPIERDLGITRSILETLSRFSHPVALITKSTLVTRDIDILADMAARGLVHVTLSVTTLDRHLARRLEPRAATPMRRLDAVRTLAEAGIPTSVNVAPLIPGLNDHEMEAILQAAAAAGACKAGYILLRLPLEIKNLFREWLDAHVPDRAARVLSLVRQTRGGALYRDRFGERMRGEGPIADLIERRFRVACARLGLDKRDYVLETSRFARPPAPGDQIALPL